MKALWALFLLTTGLWGQENLTQNNDELDTQDSLDEKCNYYAYPQTLTVSERAKELDFNLTKFKISSVLDFKLTISNQKGERIIVTKKYEIGNRYSRTNNIKNPAEIMTFDEHNVERNDKLGIKLDEDLINQLSINFKIEEVDLIKDNDLIMDERVNLGKSKDGLKTIDITDKTGYLKTTLKLTKECEKN